MRRRHTGASRYPRAIPARRRPSAVRMLSAPRSMKTAANAMSSQRAPVSTALFVNNGRTATNTPSKTSTTPSTSEMIHRTEFTSESYDPPVSSATPQRLQRIDACRAPCREIARANHHHGEQHSNQRERQRIVRRDAVRHRSEKTRGTIRHQRSDGDSQHRKHETLANYHPLHGPTCCAKCHPNSEFVS